MKFFSLTLALLAVSFASCRDARQGAVAQTNSPPSSVAATPYLPHAQPRLQTTKLYVGKEELITELAVRDTEIYTGMMWRTNMPENEAMLFVFGTARPRSFYMLNTRVPLSVAYINPDGVIEEIHDLQPLNEQSVPSRSKNIQYVLEVPQGWFNRHNISAGTPVSTSYGTLRKSVPRPVLP